MAFAAPAPRRQHDTTPPWRWRGAGLALIAVAIAGGIVLRFVAPSPLWLDEALSVRIASLSFDDMVEALRHDGHPSLYYLLLGWWMDVFGDSNGSARSLSAVASLVAVPVLWTLGRRRSETLGVLAALLGLTSPFLLRYATEARMYALLSLFVALWWLAIERALDRSEPWRLVAVGIATAALVHTHYWSFWLIAAALILCLRAVRSGDPARRRPIVAVGGAIVAGAATFVVWLGVFLDQVRSTGTPWADRARPAEILMESMHAVGGNRFEGELLGVILVVLGILGTFGVVRAGGLQLRFARGPLTVAASALGLTLVIGGGVALVTASAFEGRYAAVVVPFILLLAARGLSLLSPRVGLIATAGVVVFGLAVGLDEARRDRTQAGDVAAAIQAGARPGDIVALCPDQVGPATHRALARVGGTDRVDLAGVAYPRGDGTLVDWSDYADVVEATPPEDFHQRLVTAADGHDIWMVTGLGYKSLGNRCEAILGTLDRSHRPNRVISPSAVFEPMMLTRYEPLG